MSPVVSQAKDWEWGAMVEKGAGRSMLKESVIGLTYRLH